MRYPTAFNVLGLRGYQGVNSWRLHCIRSTLIDIIGRDRRGER